MANGFVLPSLRSAQTQTTNRANVLGAAQRLVPDAQTFAQAILDKDLHGAVSNRYVGAINQLAGDYLGKYQRNPFYAFSKEGKDQVRKMQEIVTNPAFGSLETIKKQNLKEIDRVSEKGLLDQLVVTDGGGISVMNTETGRNEIVSFDNVDPTKHRIHNIATHYGQFDQTEGDRLISYDISSVDEVTKEIRDLFRNVNKDQWKGEVDKLKSLEGIGIAGEVPVTEVRERESNRDQIQSMVHYLGNQGLSSTARNTLMSQYFRNNPSELGTEGATDRAAEWMVKQIDNLARGQRLDTNKVTTKDISGLSGAGGGASAFQQILPMDELAIRAHGSRSKQTVDAKGDMISYDAPVLHRDYQHDPQNMIKSASGRNVVDRGIDNDRLLQVGDTDNLQVMNVESGEYDKLPLNLITNSITDIDPKAATMVYKPVDANGKVISNSKFAEIQKKQNLGEISNAEKIRYLDANGQIRLMPGFEVRKIIPRERGFMGIDFDDRGTSEFFETRGYEASTERVSDYNEYSGTDALDSNILLPDKAFVADIFIPMPDQYIDVGLNTLMGGKVLTDRNLNIVDQRGIRRGVAGVPNPPNVPTNSNPRYPTSNLP